jgi:transcriptional regulator with XRE-family HTH domain
MEDKEIKGRKLAQNIKKLMDGKGLNQVELAKKAGIPRTTLTHFFTGRTNKIGWPLLYGIAKALDCPMEELIEGPQPRPEIHEIAAEIAKDLQDEIEITIANKLSKLPGLKICPKCGADLCIAPAQNILERAKKRLKEIPKKQVTTTESSTSDNKT